MARRTARNGTHTTATYTFSFQAQYPNKPGMLARIAAAVGDCGGNIGDIDVIRSTGTTMLREISVQARDSDHAHLDFLSDRHKQGQLVADSLYVCHDTYRIIHQWLHQG